VGQYNGDVFGSRRVAELWDSFCVLWRDCKTGLKSTSSVEKGYEQEKNSGRKCGMKGIDEEKQINQKRCNWGERNTEDSAKSEM
jgi:hypothetical protein